MKKIILITVIVATVMVLAFSCQEPGTVSTPVAVPTEVTISIPDGI